MKIFGSECKFMDSSRVRRKGKASTGGGNDIKFKRAEEIQEGEGEEGTLFTRVLCSVST